jgi:DMSO/TMAO reductase YedYZ heme-binding membrane subunit
MINFKKNKFLFDLSLYLKTFVFSLLIFAGLYLYLSVQKIPGTLNKAVADTATFLVALSMIFSSLGYFFNFADRLAIYRKHLGMIGFAFAVWHLLLSWSALLNLFKISTWEAGRMGPMLTGFLAFLIFTLMALISNQLSIRLLGSKLWKLILRFGYLALVLVVLHVFLLKSARWLTWYQEGMQGPPALSLLVVIFTIIVLVLRIALWWSLAKRKAR